MKIDELHKLTDIQFDYIITDIDGEIAFGLPIPGHPELEWDIHMPNGTFVVPEIYNTDISPYTEAWNDFLRTLPKKSKYRTRKAAEQKDAITITKMPKTLALPTIVPYQNSLTTVDNPMAKLQPITKELADKLQFKDGKLYFEGMEASSVNLVAYYDKRPQAIHNLDLPMLRALFSVVLEDLGELISNSNPDELLHQMNSPQYLGHSVKIYLSDFMEMLGHGRTTSKDAKDYAIAKIMSFNQVVGLMGDIKKRLPGMYAVMLFMGYDPKDNTLSFASPYINHLIMTIAQKRIETDKKGHPRLKSNGKPFVMPAYTYLVKSSIVKERNKRAIEIVCIVTTLIEQAGDNIPHIRAKTIIDRCPDLKFGLENAQSSSDKTKLLKRAFTKAWQLLHTQTHLEETYKDIQIPTTTPTAATLNEIVFEFPHKGKIKKK